MDQFKYRFNTKYDLQEFNSKSEKPCIFFGMYHNIDWINYFKYKGDKYILFGGTDINRHHQLGQCNIEIINKVNCDNLLVLSKKTHEDLMTIHINSIFFDMNLVDKSLFFISKNKIHSNNIYCYDGSFGNSRPYLYGCTLLDKLEEELSQYKFIRSSQIKYDYNDMPTLYNSVFIVLRLTTEDGNANTVQECEAMNIPVVHNISRYGLKYHGYDDIVRHIHNAYFKQNQLM